MALSDNKRLFDISTRLQIYVEGVKVQQAREFNFVLAELRHELNRILSRVKYKTLDGLTKGELNRLVVSLRDSQSRIYSKYTSQLIEQLKLFMAANAEMNRRAWVFAKLEETEGESAKIPTDAEAIRWIEEQQPNNVPLFGIGAAIGNNERLWSGITNAPIPANGLYLLPFVKTFSTSAQAGVENIIRKAWANGWTLQETIAEITGEDAKQGTASQLQRIGVQASAVTATAIQHVSMISGAAVASAVFSVYQWVSVIDNATTDICRSRNLHRYRFGAGPLPPAHIRCRSHIVPIVGTDDIPAVSFYTWAASQPEDLQNDILGEADAEALRTGKLKEKDLAKFQAKPLTIDEFRRKINEVLSR